MCMCVRQFFDKSNFGDIFYDKKYMYKLVHVLTWYKINCEICELYLYEQFVIDDCNQ